MNLKPITTATAKGRRSYQEDRLFTSTMDQGTLVGVFDGHGGDEVSYLVSEELPEIFADEISEEDVTPHSALEKSIQKINLRTQSMGSGSTLSLAFIPAKGDVVTCAVLGDSPIIIRDSEGKIVIGPEHNVRTNEAEAEAAKKRGGFVSGGYLFQSYSGDGLQMARALGDSNLDKVLSRVPDIFEVKINASSFIIVASDGAFDPDHYEFAKAAEDVVKLVEGGAEAQAVVDRALAMPTEDNVSVIVVRFDEAQ